MFTSFSLLGMWIKHIKQVWQSQVVLQSTTAESICSQREKKIRNKYISRSGAYLVLFVGSYPLFIYLFFCEHHISYNVLKFMFFE